jgi:hypothetical protein
LRLVVALAGRHADYLLEAGAAAARFARPHAAAEVVALISATV